MNAPGRRIAQIVLTMCRLLIRMNVGIIPPPKNIVITKITLKKFRPTNSFLDIGYAASSVTNTEITVNPAE